jgi:hypothetical protein
MGISILQTRNVFNWQRNFRSEKFLEKIRKTSAIGIVFTNNQGKKFFLEGILGQFKNCQENIVK